MSQRIVTAVFEKYEPASKPAHLVALFLAFMADEKGADIRVTSNEVSAKARISLRTAKEVLAAMVADGWLLLVAEGRGEAPTHYAINPTWVAANAR